MTEAVLYSPSFALLSRFNISIDVTSSLLEIAVWEPGLHGIKTKLIICLAPPLYQRFTLWFFYHTQWRSGLYRQRQLFWWLFGRGRACLISRSLRWVPVGDLLHLKTPFLKISSNAHLGNVSNNFYVPSRQKCNFAKSLCDIPLNIKPKSLFILDRISVFTLNADSHRCCLDADFISYVEPNPYFSVSKFITTTL